VLEKAKFATSIGKKRIIVKANQKQQSKASRRIDGLRIL